MRVSELSGYWFNYWTAKAEGKQLSSECDASGTDAVLVGIGTGDLETFDPAADWADGGPISERARISIMSFKIPADDGSIWTARNLTATAIMTGPTPLVAAMRAYVASHYGDEVPDA